MTDTPRTVAALQALFADNSTGAISAQDLRDFLVTLVNVLDGVTIAPTDPAEVPLTIEIPQGAQSTFGTNIMTIVRDPDESNAFGNPNLIEWDNNGSLTFFSSSGQQAIISVHDDDVGSGGEVVAFNGQGIAVGADPTNTPEPEAIWVNANFGTLPNPTISFYKKGMLKFSGVLPADADISPGACFQLFDPTNGAAKVKWKGKTLNGTVVTGQVALA